MDTTQQSIKLIWDFRGPDAKAIAEHHHIHLKTFIENSDRQVDLSGCEQITDQHHIAYIVVSKDDMIYFRDTLKPHRGTYFENG